MYQNIVFDTFVLHTRYHLLQPVLLVVGFSFVVGFFHLFSVHVRERDLWHMTHSQKVSSEQLKCDSGVGK